MKNFIIFIIIVVIAGIGAYVLIQKPSVIEVFNKKAVPDTAKETATDKTQTPEGEQEGEVPEEAPPADLGESVIGTSVEGREIVAYRYGQGDSELLFVGGIHGGYEYNTVLLAYDMMDHLEQNPGIIPENVAVTIVPVLNPDGLYKTVGTAGRFSASDAPSALADTIPGRFNANDVDLNRNFDCDWKAAGTWQNKTVSGGSEAFSEPEARAMKDYIESHAPRAVVVWYSAAGGVFTSNCRNGVLPETRAITNIYADASGYPAYEEFDFYTITGDMVNWLAGEGIPAVSVLLSTHEDVELEKNLAGVLALLEYYSE